MIQQGNFYAILRGIGSRQGAASYIQVLSVTSDSCIVNVINRSPGGVFTLQLEVTYMLSSVEECSQITRSLFLEKAAMLFNKLAESLG